MNPVWIFVINRFNYRNFKNSKILVNYIKALPGLKHIISDYEYADTIILLNVINLLPYITSIHNRGEHLINKPNYLYNISSKIKIRKNQTCYFFDSYPDSIVRSKLLGWIGVLILNEKLLKTKELKKNRSNHKCGINVWYNTRFNTLIEAVHHYIFGSI